MAIWLPGHRFRAERLLRWQFHRLSGAVLARTAQTGALLMSTRRTVPYLIAIIALLVAMMGSSTAPVYADHGDHHHGGDHEHGGDGEHDGRNHDGDGKRDGDKEKPPREPTIENTPPSFHPTDTPRPEPTNTATPKPAPTDAPTSMSQPAPASIPTAAPQFELPAAPTGPIIDPSAYQITVKCKYYEEKDATACRFAITSQLGAIAASHAILRSTLCTEVMSGDLGYVAFDAATGAQGYWFDQANDRMVLVGQVKVKGTAHYAVQVAGTGIKLTGPGLSCGISKSAGAQIIVSKYICAVAADDPRAGSSAGFVQAQNAPFQSPPGADRCRHVAEGETSFALDFVDGVPSAGGLPTRANGRVRFTGVSPGRYRLLERASHTRSDVFALTGSGLVLFRVIQYVPETRADH
jgi:hypothetical protein